MWPFAFALQRVLAEQQKEQGGMEVKWLGMSVPVLSAACHQMISTAQRHHDELSTTEGTEGKLELFDKMLMLLEDAKGSIRDDISENLKKGVSKDDDKYAPLFPLSYILSQHPSLHPSLPPLLPPPTSPTTTSD